MFFFLFFITNLPILSLVKHMHLAEDKKNTRKLEI